MAPLSSTAKATREGATSITSDPQAVERLHAQVELLGARLDRIDSTLNEILDHLSLRPKEAPIRSEPHRYHVQNRPKVATALRKYILGSPKPHRKYKYNALDTSKSQFRVLRVQDAKKFSDPLVAELVTVGLDDNSITRLKNGYVALSYTWGLSVFNKVVEVDQCHFPITGNLQAALRRFRSGYPGGYIWVDQICINQIDIDERASQVSHMRRIYKRASSVQVWLGDEADDSSLAIDLLEILAKPPKHAPGEKSITYPKYNEADVARHWNALAMFFKRPWWERVWIRQEIALHRIVHLWCGDRYLDMRSLAPALFILAHVSPLGYANTVSDRSTSLPWNYHPAMLAELREICDEGQKWVPLAQLLRMTRACKATDARDTVFSVLGLADPEIHQITPDYHQVLEEIMFRTMENALKQEFGLEALGVCQNVERTSGLPSWIPCLTDNWQAMPFKTAEKSWRRRMPHLTSTRIPRVRIEGRTLLLGGTFVDVIQSICPSQVENNASVEALEATLTSWKSFAADVNDEDALHWNNSRQHYFENNLASTAEWIQFLTGQEDLGSDVLDSENGQTNDVADRDAALNDHSRNPPMYHHLNPTLA